MKITLIAIALILVGADVKADQSSRFSPVVEYLKDSCEAGNKGNNLYLQRSGSTLATFRAKFCHSGDCRLIAGYMRKAEPRVRWFCM
jgi:hypothetical protein